MKSSPTLTENKAASLERTWLWRPALLAFVSSACIMILELVAGRILAPYVGTSLYTWTMIIAVVLAGLSLGNYLGGRVADRWASLPLLGGVYLLGGLTSLSILAVDVLDRFTALEALTWDTLPLVVALVAFSTALLFVPCVILGSISPVVVRLSVHNLATTGSAVGRIYAAGSAGSIVGTFATGFLLVSWFGTHIVVWGVGLALLILGLLLLVGGRWQWMLLSIPILVGGSALAFRLGWLNGPCTRETNYFCIQVREEERVGERVRALYLDRLLHSYTSLEDPTKLVYDYEKLYAEATAYQAQRKDRLRALFVGGGGYTFPRYMEAVYPTSDLYVIEIDPGVTEVAYDMLGLSRNTGILTANEDARMFLERQPTGTYDLIIGDAFNDYSVPYHLTTKEFNDRVRAWLADDGLYVVNIIDGPWGHFLRAYIHTLRQTFRHVYPIFAIESWRRSSRSTIVIVASDTPLDREALEASSPLLTSQLLGEEEVDTLLAEGRVVTLTDRYAPVDQMLFRVFLEQVPK